MATYRKLHIEESWKGRSWARPAPPYTPAQRKGWILMALAWSDTLRCWRLWSTSRGSQDLCPAFVKAGNAPVIPQGGGPEERGGSGLQRKVGLLAPNVPTDLTLRVSTRAYHWTHWAEPRSALGKTEARKKDVSNFTPQWGRSRAGAQRVLTPRVGATLSTAVDSELGRAEPLRMHPVPLRIHYNADSESRDWARAWHSVFLPSLRGTTLREAKRPEVSFTSKEARWSPCKARICDSTSGLLGSILVLFYFYQNVENLLA